MVLPRPPEDWATYLRQFDDSTASIFVDLACRQVASTAGRPVLIQVDLNARTQRENGFPDTEEYDGVFYPLEDLISRDLQAADPSVLYAGRFVTTQGLVSYLYYGRPARDLGARGLFGGLFRKAAPTDSRPDRVVNAIKARTGYDAAVRVTDDPDWSAFRELLEPDASELDFIYDRRVIQALINNGDDPSIPRDIDHFIICPDASAQAKLVSIGKSLGFRTTAAQTDDGSYSVELVRSDAPEDIAEIARPLREAAAQLDAEYDGWGCVAAGAGGTERPL